MSCLPAQTIRRVRPLAPICERTRLHGVTYGIGPAGYDIRISEDRWVWPGRFFLASAVEYFMMPTDLKAVVHDKSTWIRCGLAVHNTVIEPGWQGYLTLELKKQGWRRPKKQDGWDWLRCLWPIFKVRGGSGIAQVMFDRLEEPTDMPYEGKYQGQNSGPVEAIFEPSRLLPGPAPHASDPEAAPAGTVHAMERIIWGAA